MSKFHCKSTTIARQAAMAALLSACAWASLAVAQSAAPDPAAAARLRTALADELGFSDVAVSQEAGQVSIAFRPATDNEDELRARMFTALVAGQEFAPDSNQIQLILHKAGLPVGIVEVPTASVKGLVEGAITPDVFFDSWKKTTFPEVVPQITTEVPMQPGDLPASLNAMPERESDFVEVEDDPPPASNVATPGNEPILPTTPATPPVIAVPSNPPTPGPTTPAATHPPSTPAASPTTQPPTTPIPVPPNPRPHVHSGQPHAHQPPAPRLVFSEDFSQGPGTWLINGQPPTLRQGRAYFLGGNNKTLGNNLPLPIEDFALEFDSYASGERLNFFVTNQKSQMYAASIRRSGTLLIAHGPGNVAKSQVAFDSGKWHRYRFVRQGNRLELQRDGLRIGRYLISGKLQGPGYLGFSSEGSTVGLDNVRFYDLSQASADVPNVTPPRLVPPPASTQPHAVHPTRPQQPGTPPRRPRRPILPFRPR